MFTFDKARTSSALFSLNHNLFTVLNDYTLVVLRNLLASEVESGSVSLLGLNALDASGAGLELEAIEAELRTCAVNLVGLVGLDVESVSAIVLLVDLDTVEILESGAVFLNIESLVGVQHNSNSDVTIDRRSEQVESTILLVTIGTITSGVSGVTLYASVSNGSLEIVTTFTEFFTPEDIE